MPSKNRANRIALLVASAITIASNDHGADAFVAPSPMLPISSPASVAADRQRPFANPPLHAFAVETQVAMSAVDAFFQSQPYVAAFLTCSVKASAADMLTQTTENRESTDSEPMPASSPPPLSSPQPSRSSSFTAAVQPDVSDLPMSMSTSTSVDDGASNFDFSRNLGFLLHGGLCTGLAQNYLYTVLYPAWFHLDEGWTLVAKEVLMDNAVYGPLVYLPIAYAFKTAFTTGDFTWNAFTSGVDGYIDDVMNRGLLLKYWSIWIPVQFLTFGVIPQHFQVAFVAFVSFFWVCLLSSVANAGDVDNGDVDKEQAPLQSQKMPTTPSSSAL